jgi:hypothetical protein
MTAKVSATPCSNAMSALGQKQTSASRSGMSALPPKADIRQRIEHVCFVPEADIDTGATLLPGVYLTVTDGRAEAPPLSHKSEETMSSDPCPR